MPPLALPRPVTEVKQRLEGTESRYACWAVQLEPGRRAVLAMRMVRTYRPPVPGAPEVPVGTWTLAHFWRDRPYNLYYWVDAAGQEQGAYFNLVRRPTRIARDGVTYRDLGLDLWAGQGGPRLLDREDVPRDAPPALRCEAAEALIQLRRGWRAALALARRRAPVHLARLRSLDPSQGRE